MVLPLAQLQIGAGSSLRVKGTRPLVLLVRGDVTIAGNLDVSASAGTPGETFVVGDLEPCRQRDMVAWLCERFDLPFPASAPLEEVHETLRRNRRVDASRALARLGVTLKYPNYRAAFAAAPIAT